MITYVKTMPTEMFVWYVLVMNDFIDQFWQLLVNQIYSSRCFFIITTLTLTKWHYSFATFLWWIVLVLIDRSLFVDEKNPRHRLSQRAGLAIVSIAIYLILLIFTAVLELVLSRIAKSLLKFLTNVFLSDSVPINSLNSYYTESSMLWIVSNIPSLLSLFLFSDSVCSFTNWSIFYIISDCFSRFSAWFWFVSVTEKDFLPTFVLCFIFQFFALFFFVSFHSLY